METSPWKETLSYAGDTSKAMGDSHQSKDVPEGMQPVEYP